MPMVESARRAQLQAALTVQIPTSVVDENTGQITAGPPQTVQPPANVLDALASIVTFVQANATVPPGIPVSAPPPSGVGVTTGPGSVA